MNHDKHIIVIGGGIIGVTTAHCLSLHPNFRPSAGDTLTLLEACPTIASQASGKAGGFLARDWHGPRTSSLASLSWRLHVGWAERFGGEAKWGFRRMNSVGCEVEVSRKAREMSEEKVEGNPALEGSLMRGKPEGAYGEKGRSVGRWINEQARREVYGTEDSTAQVEPGLFTRAIHELATSNGLKTIHGVPTALQRDSSASPSSLTYRLSSAASSKKELSIPCTHVVVAAGPWSGQVMSMFSQRPLPISFLPGHHAILRPTDPSVLDNTAVFANLRGLSHLSPEDEETTTSPEIFPRPDGTVWVGGENDAAPLPSDPNLIASLVSPLIVDRLLRSCRLLSSSLDDASGGATVEKVDLCYRPVPPKKGEPVIEKWDEGVWVGTGHGPWGITLGPGTGARLASMVLGEADEEVFLCGARAV